MTAMGLFIDYVFRIGGFRKLYFETVEFNLEQYGSGLGKFFVEEGRLRAHEYYDGIYWDTLVMAIYSERWREVREQYSRWLDAR